MLTGFVCEGLCTFNDLARSLSSNMSWMNNRVVYFKELEERVLRFHGCYQGEVKVEADGKDELT